MQNHRSTRHGILSVAVIALLLTSCTVSATPAPTIDVNAINTSAVETVRAQFNAQWTQTAQAVPITALPTNTSIPTPAPPTTEAAIPTVVFDTPVVGITLPAQTNVPSEIPVTGGSCDNSAFVADVTVPDKTVMKPGQEFVKTWAIKNTGTCKWDDGYALAYLGGRLGGYDVKIKKKSDFVASGEGINFSVKLTAPAVPNEYYECWKMKNDRGYYFGTPVCVNIIVKK